MNHKIFFAFTACLGVVTVLPTVAAPFSDGFMMPAKTDGTIPGWKITNGFSLTTGALLSDGVDHKNFATWTVPLVGKTVTYTVNVTPTATPGGNWDTVGIGIIIDDQNYWHLALVQAPDDQKKMHFAELAEMYNGKWNAQGSSLSGSNPVKGIDWKMDVTYQFKLTVSPTQIEGQILEAGVVKYDSICKFNAPAVTQGHPMLGANGIKAKFTEVKADISDVAP